MLYEAGRADSVRTTLQGLLMSYKPVLDRIEIILFKNLQDEDNRPYTIVDISEEIRPIIEDALSPLKEIAEKDLPGCDSQWLAHKALLKLGIKHVFRDEDY